MIILKSVFVVHLTVISAQCSVQCTVYNAHCALNIVQRILYSVQCTVYSAVIINQIAFFAVTLHLALMALSFPTTYKRVHYMV